MVSGKISPLWVVLGREPCTMIHKTFWSNKILINPESSWSETKEIKSLSLWASQQNSQSGTCQHWLPQMAAKLTNFVSSWTMVRSRSKPIKNGITEAINRNSYFHRGVAVMGWKFDFTDEVHLYWVKLFRQIHEHYAVDKTSLRATLLGKVDEIVELI